MSLSDFDVSAAKRAVKEGQVIELKSNEELEDLLVAVEDGQLPGDCLMVEGYASWCRHCQKAKPAYEKLATEPGVKGEMVIARIDAAEANIGDIGGQDIHGFPAFIFIEKKTPGEVDYKFDTKEYLGDRTAPGFKEFISANCGVDRDAPSHEKTASAAAAEKATLKIADAKAAVAAGRVIELKSSADLEALITAQEEGLLPGDAMFVEAYWTQCGHCQKFESEYADYAREMAGKMPVARINSVEAGIGELAGYPLDGVPYVVFLSKKTLSVVDNKYDAERYEDMRSADALRAFADLRLEALRAGGPAKHEEEEGDGGAEEGGVGPEAEGRLSFAGAGHEADYCGAAEAADEAEDAAWLDL